LVTTFRPYLQLTPGRPFNPFSRAISSRCCATVCLSSATSFNSRTTSFFSWGGVSSSRSGGGLTHRLNRRLRSVRIGKIEPAADHPGHVTFPTYQGDEPAGGTAV